MLKSFVQKMGIGKLALCSQLLQKRKVFSYLSIFLFLIILLKQDVGIDFLKLPNHIQLEKGDWIFRGGIGTDSKLIQYLSKSEFSHIGIIVETTPHILIAHATTDDDPKHQNQVLITKLDDFISPNRAKIFAIARPIFLNTQQRIQTALYASQQVGKPFILDDKAETHFYCTTLILNAVHSQTHDFNPKWQYLDIAVFQGYYLFPQALTQEKIQWIYDSSHKNTPLFQNKSHTYQ